MAAKLEAVEALLANVARAMVDNPDLLDIEVVRGTHTTIIQLTPESSDFAMLIGRHGRTADAMRVLAGNLSAKEGHRYVLEILER